MSKCQKNKYAAGGKCGSMSGSGPCATNPGQVGEVNTSFAALLASREKQDLLLSAPSSIASPHEHEHKPQVKQAIIPVKKFAKSDIDTILEGDF
jgi:hypothetical protein